MSESWGAESRPPPLEGVLETVLYYAPDEGLAMERFYVELLGCRPIGGGAGHPFLFLRAGRSVLLLFDREASRSKVSPPPHGARGPGHTCFLVHAPTYERWKAHLEAHGVSLEEELRWGRGGRSVYFRDPAGNSLEIADRDLWPGAPEPL